VTDSEHTYKLFEIQFIYQHGHGVELLVVKVITYRN
jgi:hypothetical protein